MTQRDVDRLDREFKDVWQAITDLRDKVNSRMPWWGTVAVSGLSWVVGILMTVVVMLVREVF